MRSAPVTTRSTSPRAISDPATASATRRCGIPSRTHSQAVRREPCMTGRVSSTQTSATLLWACAERTTPSAVPYPAVARAPALQCVRIRAPGGTRAAPWSPSARLAATSSSRIAWASATRRTRSSANGRSRAASATRRIRSRAQNRLTAVGRVAASPLMATSRSARSSSKVVAGLWRAASATPKAAVTPMAGAPRTTSVRIASITSCHRGNARSISSRGRRVWSRRISRSPAQRMGLIIGTALERVTREEPQQPLGDLGVELEVEGAVAILKSSVQREATLAELTVQPSAVHALQPEQLASETEALPVDPQIDVQVDGPLGLSARVLGDGRRDGERRQSPGHQRRGDQRPLHHRPPSVVSRRARSWSGLRPATLTSLSRPFSPRTTVTAEGRRPSAAASRAPTAALARPFTGGAVTRTLSTSSRQPTISLREARGWTRTRTRAPSLGPGGIAGVFRPVRRQKALVAIEGGPQIFHELALGPLEPLDLAPELDLLGAHFLHQLLAAQLRFAHDELPLAAGRLLPLLGQPLRRQQRVLERLVPVGEPAGPLLQRRQLLLQQRVLLQHHLVVLGDVVQKGLDFVRVEATEHPYGELLLPDIEGTQTHRDLPISQPISVAIRYRTGTTNSLRK